MLRKEVMGISEYQRFALDWPHSFHLHLYYHETKTYPRPFHCIIGGAFALWGCEKVAPTEVGPSAARTEQPLKTAEPSEAASPTQAAWLRFVERVERGEIVDPVGQYVAKGTRVEVNAGSQRVARPKMDVTLRDASKGYALRAGKPAGSGTSSGSTGNRCVPQYTDPNEPCYEDPGTGGGGSGYIRDLKIVGEANSTSRTRVLNSGYTMLNADLNKGAGGAYIYLCFQRNRADVLNGLEYYQGQSYSGPDDFLTNFETQNGSFFSKPRANDYFFDIWQPNQNPHPYWSTVDLNAGAGGEYIYSYQSKTPIIINPAGGTILWPAYAGIGILSGNSSSILPPAGWNKYPRDLNEGAGGDFIYFCYRQ